MFKKTIEIYDGSFSSHFICPLGAIIVGVSVLCLVLCPVFEYLTFGWYNPIFLSLPLFFLGSLIGDSK